MKKVMLVDDELDILYGLQLMLDWEALGFQVTAMCIDGYEALEMCERAVPDIIITDIRMSGMDGLALGQYIRERYPETQLIILTSFSEYGYLQKAIDLRVAAYLLKPVDEEQLEEALLKAASEIDAKKAAAERLDELVSYRIRAAGAVLFSAYAKLLSGEQSLWESEQEAVQETIRDGDVRIMIAREDVPAQFTAPGEAELEEDFYKILTIAVRNRSELFYSGYQNGQAIFVFATEDIDQFLEKLRVTCASRMNGTYSTIVTDTLTAHEKLAAVCADARKKLKYEMFFGKSGSDYRWNAAAIPPKQSVRTADEWQEDLERALIARDSNLAEGILDSFLRYLQDQKGKMTEHEANAAVDRIEGQILEILDRQCHVDRGILEELRFSLLLTHHMHSLEHILHFISGQVADILETSDDQTRSDAPEILKPVLQYIRENYTEALTLEGVAKKFHLNASYLSRIFRKSTGQNYMTYVTNLRIDHAKQLLTKTDLVISEVALRCSFVNEPTFYTTFKRYTGISPGEFRKRNKLN